MSTSPPVTRRLAEFAVSTRWTDLPPITKHAGRRTVLNALGLAVGATRHVAVERAFAAVSGLGTAPVSTVLGRDARIGLLWAPLLNGMAMHVEDFDDTHLQTVIHPGAPIVPAALAVAEWRDASGADLLEAATIGAEVALRVGNGICPEHFDRGWHLTGTAGHIGGAVAAGKLMNLDAAQMMNCIALGAAQAAGLQEALGTMSKCFHPGKAAADGVQAALLAAKGFTGPATAIEGRRGFGAVATPDPRYDAMLDGIGETWEIDENTFKPYACGIVSHAVTDAGIQLRRQLTSPDDIESVTVTVNPVVLDVMGKRPENGLESKFSVYHSFAVGFLDGSAGPAAFTDERATARDTTALRAKTEAILDPTIAKDEARVRISTRDGRTFESHIPHATGSAARPMSDDQLSDKVRLVATPVLGDAVETLIRVAFKLDEEPDLMPLLAATSPRSAARPQ
jgi:2-methylcitrate dehydratase PrpD